MVFFVLIITIVVCLAVAVVVAQIFVSILGTQNVIEACTQSNVTNLIYTSTTDIMVGDWSHINADETVPTPTKQRHAYSDTKARAEKAVLEANGRAVQRGVIHCIYMCYRYLPK